MELVLKKRSFTSISLMAYSSILSMGMFNLSFKRFRICAKFFKMVLKIIQFSFKNTLFIGFVFTHSMIIFYFGVQLYL